MKRLPKIAVFISGNGTNLQAILDQIHNGLLQAEIALVFSDKKNALGLERAEKAGVQTLALSPKDFPDRKSFEGKLVKALREHSVEWVVLAGFMRILSPFFVRTFEGKILNIHPALLPKYPGTHAIERAYTAGEKEIGVTVHYVDEGVDTGPIILQDKIGLQKGESLEEVTSRVHKLEHRLYLEALKRVLK